ncbi:E3 ubiquitin-protein ligase LRSAM1 [Poecilia reticulata]|uniref:E3 ubiquitin-protein ligase LRSAM1 n=1 Tax=Poecilia reticulata TaxID=8081 RepID=UPI0007E987F9|nr:PREDICTED: E3 ubiquitin-protein ligase LRSAM1 [Poecilia reticulata]
MPLFSRRRKPSEDSKKRLEHQLYWSNQEGADDILDISACELAESSSSSSSPSSSLQILNVEKNRLKLLPESVCRLPLLQTLNLKGNCLAELPAAVGSLSSLRTLDISDNDVQQLPTHLAHIRTLESFTLDAASMTYPPASVCSEGTESIQRFLCGELGQEYCAPSQYLLPVLESDCSEPGSDCLDGLEEAWQSKFSDYERRKEQKLQEKLAFERHLEEKHREHTQLLLMNHSHKENMLNSVRQDQERVELGFSQQQRAQEAERQQVLERVRQAEDNISSRVSSLLMDNSRTHRGPDPVSSASLESLDRKFDRMLSLQVLDKSKAIAQILQEEEMQKAAFQALQLQKDAVHGYIRSQIKAIEAELMQLTKLEVKRRSLDAESLQEVLVEQRTALSDLLQQLLKQRDQREQELRQVLVEIEKKSDSSQQNYWMIQYQRLLDAKPLSLRMQEAGLETELVNLLCKLSAQHYLPVLAHHHVTMETLRHTTAPDLKKLGVQEAGIQKALLNWARDRAPAGTSKAETPTGLTPPPSPLAPSTATAPTPSPPRSPRTPGTPGTPVTPSAPTPVEGPGSSECVVCMEVGAQVVFLPCGHVCCCRICSDALQNCPLCRSSISQRIRLYQN